MLTAGWQQFVGKRGVCSCCWREKGARASRPEHLKGGAGVRIRDVVVLLELVLFNRDAVALGLGRRDPRRAAPDAGAEPDSPGDYQVPDPGGDYQDPNPAVDYQEPEPAGIYQEPDLSEAYFLPKNN